MHSAPSAQPCNIHRQRVVNPESLSRPGGTMTTMIERGFVWMGGAAFVASLGVGAYVLAFRWPSVARLDADHMTAAIAVNVLLFTIFALHHSILAREPVKTWLAQALPARLLRSVYVWTASLLFAITLLYWRPIGHVLYQAHGWQASGLYAMQAAGLALIVSAARSIDVLELAGIRSEATERLVIRGAYRLVRHPLYLGWLLIVWPAPLLTGDRLLLAMISSSYLLLAMPWEERSMARTLGGEYQRYRSRVRWRLIPFLY
jgi:protein-S-isoprenylcysteine O-methyltransferase Ste14